MLFRSAHLRLLVGVAVLLVAAIGLKHSADASPSPVAGIETAAGRLCGRTVSGLAPVKAPGSGRVRELVSYVDPSTGDEFLVDTRRGPIGYWSREATDRLGAHRAGDSRLSEATLVAAAKKVALRSMSDAQLRRMTVSSSMVPVGNDKSGLPNAFEYRVELTELINGIPSSNRTIIRLNPTSAELVSVLSDLGEVTVNTVPTLTEHQAILVMQDAFTMPVVSSQDATLMVWRDPVDLIPHLAWRVEIGTGSQSGFGSMASGVIDAHTGEMLQGLVSD